MLQLLLTARPGPGRVRGLAMLLTLACAPVPRVGAPLPAVAVRQDPGVPLPWDSSAGVRSI
ncbi:MAG: hypothetical protein RMK29_20110 [Myxococcales bacterium]|nr:hypothetical protein [Myxococcota bacterium]MDW8284015.1 hypothetical protein [Myxococcales bacterium]